MNRYLQRVLDSDCCPLPRPWSNQELEQRHLLIDVDKQNLLVVHAQFVADPPQAVDAVTRPELLLAFARDGQQEVRAHANMIASTVSISMLETMRRIRGAGS